MVNSPAENRAPRIPFTEQVVNTIKEQLSYAEQYYEDEYGNVWEKDIVGVVRHALEGEGYQLDPAWYSWGTKAAKISAYNSLANDIKSIFAEGGLKELSTIQGLEREIFKGLDDNTIKSIQEIESPNDIVKLWYVEYLINEKSPAEVSPEIKAQISEQITDIIFDNSYGIGFISTDRGKTEYYIPQYDLMKKAYFASLSYAQRMAVKQGQDPNAPPTFLSFNEFQRLLQSKITKAEVELSTFKTILSHGINPQEKTVLGIQTAVTNMLRELREFHIDTMEDIKYFKDALDQIRAYRELKFPADSNPYDAEFYNFYVIAYHLGKLLPRTIGFDIRHFVPLAADIFVAGKHDLKYARHHFRALLATVRKGSMDINDLILTDANLHKSYESYVKTKAGEDTMQKLLKDFQTLMTMKGRGEGGKITKEDIMKIIDKEFYTIWFADEKFNEYLDIFNRRREDLKDFGEEMFILKHYIKTYKAYFTNSKLTFSEIVDKGYEKVQSRYLGNLP